VWAPEEGVSVPGHAGPAEFAHTIDDLSRLRSHEREICGLQDQVWGRATQVCDYGLQRRQAAVNVGHDGDVGLIRTGVVVHGSASSRDERGVDGNLDDLGRGTVHVARDAANGAQRERTERGSGDGRGPHGRGARLGAGERDDEGAPGDADRECGSRAGA
jgi:hypothetical protein